jgi:hypothetical protein
MSPEDLDRVYTQLSHLLTRVGEENAALFLSRFAMLAIVELEEPDLCSRLLESAAKSLCV